MIGLFADDDCDSDDVGSGSAEFADGRGQATLPRHAGATPPPPRVMHSMFCV